MWHWGLDMPPPHHAMVMFSELALILYFLLRDVRIQFSELFFQEFSLDYSHREYEEGPYV